MRWRNQLSGEETEKPIWHLLLSIGAAPAPGGCTAAFLSTLKVQCKTGASVPQEVRSGNN